MGSSKEICVQHIVFNVSLQRVNGIICNLTTDLTLGDLRDILAYMEKQTTIK